MARLPRLVIPDIPYHVTQRGNRRQQTFFEEADYALYRDLLAQSAQKAGAQLWCYCLMPNHVHIMIVPSDEDGLRRTFADTHRRYTGYINARNRWTGHFWQGRALAPWRRLRMSATSGRPLGSDAWLDTLEAKTGRMLTPQKRAPKRTHDYVHSVNWHRNSHGIPQPRHHSRRSTTRRIGMIRTAILALTVALAPLPALAQPAPAKFVTVEYYYRIKWGSFDEFQRLYAKNHQPLLDALKEQGLITAMTAQVPFTHMAGGTRWDLRVTITFRDADAAVVVGGDYDKALDLATKRLFPDKAKFLAEEAARFALLEEHWDVIVVKAGD
jgi:REP element-mobilizing transposase RayT